MASNTSRQFFGSKQVDPKLSTVPAVAADLTAANTIVFEVTLCNKSAGDVVVTMTDKQTVAKTFIKATLSAGMTFVVPWAEGLFCSGGVTWIADTASAVDGSVVAWYSA